jgi:hypothetical protein
MQGSGITRSTRAGASRTLGDDRRPGVRPAARAARNCRPPREARVVSNPPSPPPSNPEPPLTLTPEIVEDDELLGEAVDDRPSCVRMTKRFTCPSVRPARQRPSRNSARRGFCSTGQKSRPGHIRADRDHDVGPRSPGGLPPVATVARTQSPCALRLRRSGDLAEPFRIMERFLGAHDGPLAATSARSTSRRSSSGMSARTVGPTGMNWSVTARPRRQRNLARVRSWLTGAGGGSGLGAWARSFR